MATPLGIEKLIPSVSCFIIFNYLDISLHSLHHSHIVHTVPNNLIIVVALLLAFHSNLVVEYISIVTHSAVQMSTSLLEWGDEKIYNRL